MKSGSVVATVSQQGLEHDIRGKHPQPLIRRSLVKELASRGVRMTSQRKVIIGIIQNASRHLDAAKILELAKSQDAAIDRATVYRTLALLKNFGLIDELDLMHLEGEKHFYEAKTTRDHSHLACIRCGAILEYTSPAFEALREEIAQRNRFQVKVLRLEVGGICARCCAKSRAKLHT
jgi:Fur family transcriptional regulator, ferric uptake regulator